jgi:hypothetical protein
VVGVVVNTYHPWEVEIGRILVSGQPEKKKLMSPPF